MVNSGTNPGDLAERVNSGANPEDLAERVNSGTNPGDLAERVNSSTNPGDLAERVNSATNPGDLAEMVNSGTNPGDLAEMVNSGTNPEDLAEKVNSGTNPGDLAEMVNSGTNPRDLAEKVNSGTNPEDLAEKVNSGTNPGDLVERGDPEANSSGASSGPPSSVDARVLRDLEVMKADHDLDTVVTEGSLALIRGRYSIPVEYKLHVPQSGNAPIVRTRPACASQWMLWRPVSGFHCTPHRRVSKMVEDLPQPGSAQLVTLPHHVSGRVPRGRDYPDSRLVHDVFSPL
ncbi:hypothetical protein GW17_00021311 [Ensete ventricosum]|nr:hypothetical protein GW17_00021311 [Ensete ventricosum]RZR98459.1 hypothetical protein BHM03_00027790 [Ensete ventricosum]